MVTVEFYLYLVKDIYLLLDVFGYKLWAIFPEHILHRFIPLLQSPPNTVNCLIFCLQLQLCGVRYVQCRAECIKKLMNIFEFKVYACRNDATNLFTGDFWR